MPTTKLPRTAAWDKDDCCTACGHKAISYWDTPEYPYDPSRLMVLYTPFCPYCGAQMVRPQ